MGSMSMGASGEMKMTVQRTAPADTARAQSVLNYGMQMFGSLTYAQTDPGAKNPNGTHRKIPEAMKQQWHAAHPDLPIPNMVVFDKAGAGGRPIGLLFISPNGPDLGMGPMHQHQPGKPFMAHMWFVPGNLDLAFSDTTRKAEAEAAAARR